MGRKTYETMRELRIEKLPFHVYSEMSVDVPEVTIASSKKFAMVG